MDTNYKTPLVYAVPVTKPEDVVGETPTYRHPAAVNGLTENIKRLPHVTSLQGLYEHCAKAYADTDCLGTRKKLPDGSLGLYEFKTYQTVYDLARKAGSAIMNLDLAPITTAKGYPDCRLMAIY